MDIAVFKEAQEAYARGDYKTALIGFTACTSDVAELSGAETGKFYHLIGNCYIKSGQPAKAAEFYSKAMTLAAPDRQPSLLVNLGTAYLSSDEYQKALSSFAKALDYPDYATPYKALSGIGAVQLKLGAAEAAGAAYREAALDPANPTPGKALVNLGACFMELDRVADAVATYETALDLGLPAHNANKCRASLGQAYLAQGRVGEAVEAFEEATLDGTYTLSTVAAHDWSMARTLRDRFGDYLGVAQPSSAPAPLPEPEPEVEPEVESEPEFIEDEAVEPEFLDVADEEVVEAEEGVFEEAEEEPESDEGEEMWDPAPLPEDEPALSDDEEASEDEEAAEAEESEEGELIPVDASDAITQVFPVVSVPVIGESDDETEDESAEELAGFEPPALDEDLPQEAFKAMDEDEEALIPSPEDTAFFTIREEDIEKAAKEERRKARKSHTGLKVALAIVIILILVAAAGALAYVRGYGYPLQEQVAHEFMDAAIDEQSTDTYWNDAVAQESRDSQMTVLKGVKSYEITAVERNISNSTVYLKAALSEGGTAYYEIVMGRDLIGWDVEYVELYFPSEH